MPSHNKVTSKYRPESQSCKRVTEKSQEFFEEVFGIKAVLVKKGLK